MSGAFTYALAGGIDEASQPLAIQPGRALAAINHEVVDNGYARIDGFERFDGHTSPTDFPFWMIPFTAGVGAIVAGNTITGLTSGATGVVLVDADLTSGAWDGTGEGTIGFRTLTGNFVAGEAIRVGGVTKATSASAQYIGTPYSGDTYEESVGAAGRTYARALIAAVPGSGPIRGVWEYNGTVYAFRDNIGATAGAIYKSTASGWSAVGLGKSLAFTSGGTTEIVAGNTVTGATSAATGVVAKAILSSGSWAGGDAAGTLILTSSTGAFVAENLNVGASLNVATVAGAATANALPAGGRYFFITHNFYGGSGTRLVYGCNGVGPAFEFDGTYFAPITTGATPDTPTRIAVFRNQLFLALPNGSVQGSEGGEPFGWDGASGAFVFGIGSDVTDFIASFDSLTVLGEHGVFALIGNDSTDFTLVTITLEAGALPFTGQRIGRAYYLDNRGLRSVEAAQSFGNFAMGAVTQSVQRTLNRKRLGGAMPVASTLARTKNQYRLMFDDGTGLSFYMGRKFPEPMYFDLGKVVTCAVSVETADNLERMFFGDSSGYVYEFDKGRSFDGSDVGAVIKLAYANMGSPNVLKRVHKVAIEAASPSACTINLAVEFDYSNNEQTATSTREVEAEGTGALWGVGNWSEFYWSGPSENVLEADVEGQGRNASLIVHSTGDDIPAYVLRGATIFYSPRGAVR